MVSIFAPDPAALGSIPVFAKIFQRKKIVNVVEVNQHRCLEGSGQWLENVDQTLQVQASGKLVEQKEPWVRNLATKFAAAEFYGPVKLTKALPSL